MWPSLIFDAPALAFRKTDPIYYTMVGVTSAMYSDFLNVMMASPLYLRTIAGTVYLESNRFLFIKSSDGTIAEPSPTNSTTIKVLPLFIPGKTNQESYNTIREASNFDPDLFTVIFSYDESSKNSTYSVFYYPWKDMLRRVLDPASPFQPLPPSPPFPAPSPPLPNNAPSSKKNKPKVKWWLPLIVVLAVLIFLLIVLWIAHNRSSVVVVEHHRYSDRHRSSDRQRRRLNRQRPRI